MERLRGESQWSTRSVGMRAMRKVVLARGAMIKGVWAAEAMVTTLRGHGCDASGCFGRGEKPGGCLGMGRESQKVILVRGAMAKEWRG